MVQSGYVGHSLAHPRLVQFSPRHLEKVLELDREEPGWKYRCLGSFLSYSRSSKKISYCGQPFQTKGELVKHQEASGHTEWEASVEAEDLSKKMRRLSKLSSAARKGGCWSDVNMRKRARVREEAATV
ncbi:MAG: hypothetical protein JRN54_02370 [Nitrososphaerota archaeon]|nr:hypothetical protein [Nitrososphaerota archaeon]MDG7016021.1 hypothetical protein [Nitrososphaerota archaeon]